MEEREKKILRCDKLLEEVKKLGRGCSLRFGGAAPVSTPPELLSMLAECYDYHVRMGVAKTTATPPEVLAFLAGDDNWWVREAVAGNRSTPQASLNRLLKRGLKPIQNATRANLAAKLLRL